MNVTTTSLRQGKFETRFWHKIFEEEVGRVKGHFGPINTSVPFALEFLPALTQLRSSSTRHLVLPLSTLCTFSIAVHPQGTSYASGGEDGFVRVHHYDESYFRAKPYGDMDIKN